jgi:proteasome lid subunit RPN8/RPN11
MIEPADLKLELEDWSKSADDTLKDRIAIWHSHPSGLVGPSRADMQKRIEGVAYLVVTIESDGAFTPCWF